MDAGVTCHKGNCASCAANTARSVGALPCRRRHASRDQLIMSPQGHSSQSSLDPI